MLVGSIAACPRLGLLHLADGLELAITAGKADKHHECNGNRGRGGGSAGVLVHKLHALGGKHATVRMQHGRGDIDQHGGDHGSANAQHDADGREQALCKHHGGGNLLGIGRGLGAGRGGKGDAIGLDEARDSQRAGNGERDGSEHGHDHDGLVALHGGVKERLVGKPLGHKAVEGRDGRDGKHANKEADGRCRHTTEQTAHLLHIARTRGVQQRTGAQEQLALKHRVVKRVVEGGHQSRRRCRPS